MFSGNEDMTKPDPVLLTLTHFPVKILTTKKVLSAKPKHHKQDENEAQGKKKKGLSEVMQFTLQ